MENRNPFVELFHRLKDPHLVSRFQQMCGVRGTLSRSSSNGSSEEADRTHSHNNGACGHHITGEGEGEKEYALRKRTTKKNSAEEGTYAPQNGAVVSTASAGGETLGAGSNGRRFAGSTAEGEDVSGGTEPEEGGEAPSSPRSSTLKPLRKNSLTGDAGQEFLIENRFLYYLFTFGTELGNEFFYITFFPSVIWNVDAFVGRRLIMVWVWVMYLGQCTKDVLRWSRPASPPVVKVEMFYNSEYSMPSTHAMSGTAIPFALFFMTYGRWQFPFPLGFSLALSWCLLVCVSRIYMGMHSVLMTLPTARLWLVRPLLCRHVVGLQDVIAGVLYSSLILLFFLPALDLIDGFNLTCRYAPLVIISLHLGLGLFSFTLDTWSTSRGDTAQILGTGAGIALASHVNHCLGAMPDPTPDQLPLITPGLSWGLVGMVLLRVVLGVLVLVATRAVMKAIAIPLVCWVSGVPGGDVRKARQHMEVELPYRYIVYGSVGFNVLFLVPLLFRQMQLS